MSTLALSHRGRAAVLPPLELLEPFIERTENHFFWLGEFYDDGLDRSAVFTWAPPAEHPTKFMVPRLLWQLAHPGVVVRRLLLRNTCGLFTCVNPAHWTRPGAPTPTRIRVPDDVAACPAVLGLGGAVHVLWDDAESAVCGDGPRVRSFPKNVPVTCSRCIVAWVAAGHSYDEVP